MQTELTEFVKGALIDGYNIEEWDNYFLVLSGLRGTLRISDPTNNVVIFVPREGGYDNQKTARLGDYQRVQQQLGC